MHGAWLWRSWVFLERLQRRTCLNDEIENGLIAVSIAASPPFVHALWLQYTQMHSTATTLATSIKRGRAWRRW